MNRLAPVLALGALALAGCSYTGHGEWLDQVSVKPNPVVQRSPEEQAQLEARAAQLHAQGDAVRQQMAFEKSRVRRIDELRRLKDIGDELRPVENALRGGPLPRQAGPEPQPPASGA